MKKLNIYILSATVLLFTQNVLMAQGDFTLSECRNQAIEYNKQLKIAGYQKAEAKAYQKAARTAYLPTLSADASIMHRPQSIDAAMPGGFLPTAESEEAAARGEYSGVSNVYSPGMSMALDNITYITGGLSVTQPIYAGGKIRYSNKKANVGVEMSELGYDLKFSEVVELTDNAFWQVATIEANIQLAESYIKMLSELQEQMTEMHELGLTPASEKLKVSVQKNEAELQLLKARNGLKVSKMYLNQIIGRDLNSELNIVYDSLKVELIDLSNGVELAANNRSELKLMQKQIELAQYDKKIALADYLPSAGVSAQYSTMYVNDILDDIEFQPMLAGSITIPLFSWGQGKQKQRAAKMAINRATEQLNNTTELVNLEVFQVKVQVEEAYEAILIAQKNIAEAEESLEETKASFEVGLNTTTDLLNAQADWQKAKANYISAMAQFKIQETAWHKATGNLYNVD